MSFATDIVQLLLMGIFVGGIYAIMTLGLSLIFVGIRKMLNLAHGYFALVASYLSLLFALNGLDPFISIILVAPVCFLIGYALQYVLLNKVVFRQPSYSIILLFGVGCIIENLLLIYWKTDPKSLAPYATYSLKNIEIGWLRLPLLYFIDFIVSLVLMFFLYIFMKKTYIGRAIRATSEDYVTAQLFGVNPAHIFAFTFAVGSLLAAVGGILIGLTFTFVPSSGMEFLIISFGAMILGGLGSIRGALVGGLLVGVLTPLSSYFVGVRYSAFITYIVILFALAIKPEGLFGGKV